MVERTKGKPRASEEKRLEKGGTVRMDGGGGNWRFGDV